MQLVLPKILKEEVLHLVHNHKTSAPLATAKVIKKVQKAYYWPNYKTDIVRWCTDIYTRCKTCERVNPQLNPKRAPLQPKPTYRRMDRVAIDLMKVPASEEGYNSIMVVTDTFIK